MSAFLFHPGDRRKAQVRHVAGLAGVPMGEVLRRMVDYCGQPHVLNALFPHLSGTQWGVLSGADVLGTPRGQ